MKIIKHCLAIAFVMLSGIMYGQQIPVYCVFDGQKVSYDFYSRFCSNLSDNCKGLVSQPSSAITIQPSIKRSATKQIEGIETKKAGKTSVIIRIKDLVTGRDSVLKKEYDVAGAGEYEMDKKVLDRLAEDTKFWEQINRAVASVFSQADCKKIEESVKSAEAKEGVSQSLMKLSRAEFTYSNCKDGWAAYSADLKNKINMQICEQSLYEARIMINSGKDHMVNRAVALLLQIPPDAKCRAEALKISEELFEKSGINEKNKEKLTKYRSLVSGNGYIQWLELISD